MIFIFIMINITLKNWKHYGTHSLNDNSVTSLHADFHRGQENQDNIKWVFENANFLVENISWFWVVRQHILCLKKGSIVRSNIIKIITLDNDIIWSNSLDIKFEDFSFKYCWSLWWHFFLKKRKQSPYFETHICIYTNMELRNPFKFWSTVMENNLCWLF